jgi:hypothetical protein
MQQKNIAALTSKSQGAVPCIAEGKRLAASIPEGKT